MKNLLDGTRRTQSRASSEKRTLEIKKNRSFDNVKAYCLAKITRTIDTKDEFSKVERTRHMRKVAAKVVKQ